MVYPTHIGGLLTRTNYLTSSSVIRSTSQQTFLSEANSAIPTLTSWFNETTGIFSPSTGWWNSANCLTVLADYTLQSQEASDNLDIHELFANSFNSIAQVTSVQVKKSCQRNESICIQIKDDSENTAASSGTSHFLNNYYDDEGWWALALIKMYQAGMGGLEGAQSFLTTSRSIFEDMQKGTSKCGGIYWDKKSYYTNAIANELYFSVAASLANQIPDNQSYYAGIAKTQWEWFKSSGMINSQHLINDGLTTACQNNNATIWTYNQGVVLGGLVDLYKITKEQSLLDEASAIAIAAIESKSKNGILFESCEPDCDNDASQFKGIFMRNLGYLYPYASCEDQATFKTFITKTADSIWKNDRDVSSLGVSWSGPYSTATATTQSSALDALVAAIVATGSVKTNSTCSYGTR